MLTNLIEKIDDHNRTDIGLDDLIVPIELKEIRIMKPVMNKNYVFINKQPCKVS